ncbi:MAG: ribosomal protein S19 family protein [Nanoarchaeota archaeon]
MAEDKVFKFKGKSLEELQKMNLEELGLLLTSDFRRKLKRGFTEQEEKLLKKIRAGEKNIKTHVRDMYVLPEMAGQKISIYTGKEFIAVTIDPEMIGMRFGELAPTRKIGVKHAGGDKK